MDESTLEHVHPKASLVMDKFTVEKVYLKTPVAMDKSMLQQVGLTVSMSMDKAMPEYLEVSVVTDKTTTQQVSEGTVANGKGCTRSGTPQSDCGCG